ncbi:hypothetical protein M0R04_08155 [Candidatus Dojkabacteria bacterium]|jgi:hypothetical protein|nr:hypothetical protein [Candidatus Dojkabacteria bacterium]
MSLQNLTQEDVKNMAYGRIYKGSTKQLMKGFGGTLFFTGMGLSFQSWNRTVGIVFLLVGIAWFVYYLVGLYKLSKTKDKLEADLLAQWNKDRNASS